MYTYSMETIYLSLVHTGSYGYLFHEIPSICIKFCGDPCTFAWAVRAGDGADEGVELRGVRAPRTRAREEPQVTSIRG